MPWNELHIATTATTVDPLSDELTELGAVAITLRDAGDEPIYEPSAATPRVWAKTIIVALFDFSFDLAPVIQFLENQQSKGCIEQFHLQPVKDEDWVRRSLDSFKPLSFGNRLWICPSWHQPPDPQAVNIILDPGLAFGTGTHPTTALCLEWLDRHINSQDLLIDYGCGSGILGIAALKLGVKKVIAMDNDPQALLATQQNAEQNHIYPPVFTVLLAPSEAPKADILMANILAQPLITLAPHLASLIKSGGRIVLSGILEDQASAVAAAYAPWFAMDPPVKKEDWVLIAGVDRTKNNSV